MAYASGARYSPKITPGLLAMVLFIVGKFVAADIPLIPDGHGGLVSVEIQGAPSKMDEAMMQSLALSLFPGPIVASVQEDASPFDGPDPLLLDMMSEAGNPNEFMMRFQGRHTSNWGSLHHNCQKDLFKHCKNARSQLHCLGQHPEDISPACRKDAGKSLPFTCSAEIDKYCDVLSSGVLPCLEKHVASLAGSCKDSVLATRVVVSKPTHVPHDKLAEIQRFLRAHPEESNAAGFAGVFRLVLITFGICCAIYSISLISKGPESWNKWVKREDIENRRLHRLPGENLL